MGRTNIKILHMNGLSKRDHLFYGNFGNIVYTCVVAHIHLMGKIATLDPVQDLADPIGSISMKSMIFKKNGKSQRLCIITKLLICFYDQGKLLLKFFYRVFWHRPWKSGGIYAHRRNLHIRSHFHMLFYTTHFILVLLFCKHQKICVQWIISNGNPCLCARQLEILFQFGSFHQIKTEGYQLNDFCPHLTNAVEGGKGRKLSRTDLTGYTVNRYAKASHNKLLVFGLNCWMQENSSVHFQ